MLCIQTTLATQNRNRESASQYIALEQWVLAQKPNSPDWHIKPKMHMFLELRSEASRPNLRWCYRDEDYGGTVTALARHRGSRSSAGSWSARLLDLFRIKQPTVRILA